MTSLVLGEDVIATRGLGQVPGVAAVTLSTLSFVAGLWAAVRRAGQPPAADGLAGAEGPPSPTRSQPSYGGAAWTALAAFLGYLAGVWFGAVATGAGVAVASAVAGRLATTWFGLVIAAAAFVAAWSAIALVRTHARRPRWPWEDEFDE